MDKGGPAGSGRNRVFALSTWEGLAMKRTSWLFLLSFGAFACGSCLDESSAQEGKGTVVAIDGLQSRTPADWKEEEPPEISRRMRFKQFRLPRVKGDKDDAELVIFFFGPGGGGSAEANIERWKGLMVPPEGKKIDDVSKVEKLKVGAVSVTALDVHGTYLYKERPFDPNAQAVKRPDYRLIGVVFESPKGPYFMRLVGPAKTVEQHKKGFDEWLRAFK
jgi:hypothetical protein